MRSRASVGSAADATASANMPCGISITRWP
jgi:hypothetical protein